jgi:hypothetical protein
MSRIIGRETEAAADAWAQALRLFQATGSAEARQVARLLRMPA